MIITNFFKYFFSMQHINVKLLQTMFYKKK